MSQKVPPKRDVMLALLQQADSVYVNFDPRREGVLVPPQLKKSARVVLQYGMNMAIPIPDLDVGEGGIGATLSFDQRPCWTFVPWSAVFAIVSRDQRGMLWESDVPPEVELDQKKPEGAGASTPTSKRKPEAAKGAGGKKPQAVLSATAQPAKRPTLRAVDGGRDEGATAPTSASPAVSPPTTLSAAPPLAPAPPPPVAAHIAPSTASSTPHQPKAANKIVREEKVEAPASRADDAGSSATATASASAPTGSSERSSEGKPLRDRDEIVELPKQEPKKKRELPPYLRVVK